MTTATGLDQTELDELRDQLRRLTASLDERA
jgi:hypothetical protein